MMPITETLRKELRFQLGNQRNVASTKQDILPVLTWQREALFHMWDIQDKLMQLNYEPPLMSVNLSRRSPQPLSRQSYLLAVAEGMCKTLCKL